MNKFIIISCLFLLSACNQDIGQLELNSHETISGNVYIDNEEKFTFSNLGKSYDTGDFNLELHINKNKSILNKYKQKYAVHNINDFNIALPIGKHTVSVQSASADGRWIFYSHHIVEIKASETRRLEVKLHRIPTVEHGKYLLAQKKLIKLSKAVKKDNARYIDNGDGTVTDKATQLMWKKCAEGLSGEQCNEGRVKKLKWHDAQEYASNSSFTNQHDWRLPSYNELQTLSYCSKGRKDIKLDNDGYLGVVNDKIQNGQCKEGEYQVPTINQTLFPRTPIKRFWSASELIDYERFAFYIHFGTGSIYYDDINNTNRFRLLRNLKQKTTL